MKNREQHIDKQKIEGKRGNRLNSRERENGDNQKDKERNRQKREKAGRK